MTVFRLKQLASTSAHAAAGAIRWNYDRAELIADGIVHGIGVLSGLIAATVLIVLAAVFASTYEVVSVSVYAFGLLAMLGFSAAYNLWPVSRGKWLLRRFDHSAIYILIAATYTPVFAQLQDRVFAMSLLAGVWSVAAVGIVLKLFFPGRFDRLSVGLYLAMGWSGLIAYDAGLSSLPQLAVWFIVAGGLLYSFGVIFHAWHRLRFQNAIWHSFVLLGAALPLYRRARSDSGLKTLNIIGGPMQVAGQVVVVTGGANGIGRALCEAFHRAGAAKIVVADLDLAGAQAVAASIDGAAFKCDVGREEDIRHVIEQTEAQFGPIALFCSNAGIGGGFDPMSVNAGGANDEPWAKSWAIHVMAHVYAARHLIPRMKARGGGYFLNTISAAGLLSQVGSPAYSTTKHAAVGFAENLAISHKADGIKVSILCPQGVDTNMLRSIPKGPQSGDGDLSPEQVAQDALAGLDRKRLSFCRIRRWLLTCARRPRITTAGSQAWAKIQAKMREGYGK